MTKTPISRWLFLAVGVDAIIIIRRLWTLAQHFYPHRTLSDWIAFDPNVPIWGAFIIAGIVAIIMAGRNRLTLLYWNLWYLAMLAFYAPPGSSLERPLLITGSIAAAIATYISHRQIKISALPN